MRFGQRNASETLYNSVFSVDDGTWVSGGASLGAKGSGLPTLLQVEMVPFSSRHDQATRNGVHVETVQECTRV